MWKMPRLITGTGDFDAEKKIECPTFYYGRSSLIGML
jgi:hypothetical protein